MKPRHLAAALLVPLALAAQGAPLLALTDPEGDDVGDGSLVYPREPVYEPGDLDLRLLRVFDEGGALRFEVTFRNPVRDPAQVKSGLLGSEDLSLFARRGFYGFNLDIYLDLDRIEGSGQTTALPGRRARFEPAHAWDKAIVLTPRPELMQRQLRDALVEAAGPSGAHGVDRLLEDTVHFVRDARVRGRTVTFSVPRGFVDAPALARASLVAMVTAARLTVEADLSSVLGRPAGRPLDRLPLGVALPEAGRPAATMGYRSDAAPATSIVDLLAPDARQQAAELAGAPLTGLNAENRYGASWVAAARPATAQAARAAGAATAPAMPPSLQSLLQPVGADGAVPDPAAVMTVSPVASTPAPPAAGRAVPSAAAPTTAAPTAAPAPPPPTPTTAAVSGPVSSTAAAPASAATARAASAPARTVQRPRDAAFLEEQENRLRTLRRLREQGLITEEEFQRKRKEIIDAL